MMYLKLKNLLAIVLTIAGLFIVGLKLGYAAADPRVLIELDNPTPLVGDLVNVTVLIEDAPVVYGAQLSLTYDPTKWAIQDMDTGMEGLQFIPGNFINPTGAFVLQNAVDANTGTLSYALSLVNPAPPVDGDGTLAQFSLKALEPGVTQISITEALLGTQSGETIQPVFTDSRIEIASEAVTGGEQAVPDSEESAGLVTSVTEARKQNTILSGTPLQLTGWQFWLSLLMALVLGGCLFMAIQWMVKRIRPRPKNPVHSEN